MTERLERKRLKKIDQAAPEKVDPIILSKEANLENVEHDVIVHNNNVLETTKELEWIDGS